MQISLNLATRPYIDIRPALKRLRTDHAYVEKVIRRKLGYAKPEEYIFRFEE